MNRLGPGILSFVILRYHLWAEALAHLLIIIRVSYVLIKVNSLEVYVSVYLFVRWIHSGEAMLGANFSIPNSLSEAQTTSEDHQQFQVIHIYLTPLLPRIMIFRASSLGLFFTIR